MRGNLAASVLLAAAGAYALSTNRALTAHVVTTGARVRPPLLRDQEFDLGRPTFDVLEWSTFRRETVLRYTLINRSEQLRILFFGSSALVSLGTPYLLGELLFIDGLPEYTNAIAFGASALFGALTTREKAARGSKLRRLEREFALAELSISQPGAAVQSLAGVTTLSALRDRRRVVAVYGEKDLLASAVAAAAVYRRRLKQSGVVLVAVLVGESSDAWESQARAAQAAGWLWQPSSKSQWEDYFAELLAGRSAGGGDGAWWALSLTGRSCGSGLGTPPWDELLGTRLPPMQPIAADEADAALTDAERGVLEAQRHLYAALTADPQQAAARIESLCVDEQDAEVSQLAESGRLDNWTTVLADGVTAGMQLSSADALVAPSGVEAWSTAIEHPNGGMGTLLCTQRWRNVAAEGEPSVWKLVQHRTIPYVDGLDAIAALRCDCRGCVALQRIRQQ